MKKMLKILPILMMVVMILMTCSPVLATGDKASDSTSSSTQKQTIAGVEINPDTSKGQKVSGIGNQILGIIQVIGTVVAVGVLMVLGIKYMMGSAEEKAEYKKTMLPYLIGALLLFAAVNLAAYIVALAQDVSKV